MGEESLQVIRRKLAEGDGRAVALHLADDGRVRLHRVLAHRPPRLVGKALHVVYESNVV